MTGYIVIFPLLCLQCISAQCIGSRIDEFPAFPNIPAEYLAMGNYGAMDFLPESDCIISNMFPTSPIPLVQEGIYYGDRLSPYAIDPLNFEISSQFEPYAENQASPFFAKPTCLSLPLEVSLSSTCPYNEQYSFNPFAYTNPSLYPAAVTSPSVVEFFNPFAYSAPSAATISPYIAEIFNPLAYPALSTAAISSPLAEVLSPFANPTLSTAAISPSIAEILNQLVYAVPSAAVSPLGFGVPLPFETPVLVNPYTTPSLAYEALGVTNLPNYITPLSTWAEPAAIGIPNFVPSSSGFSPRISELLRSFKPSMNIKCLGGSGPSALAASKGRGFLTTSSSPIRPTGISIASENVYQGSVSVTGRLPFLGTVGFGGTLPSFGSGAVNYRCGNGNVAILSEESYISEGYPYLDTQYF